jgi:anti-anti-sigma factor
MAARCMIKLSNILINTGLQGFGQLDPAAPLPAMERTMQIDTRKVYDVLVIDIEGRLDSRTSGDIGDRMVAIAQGPDKHVLVNLAKLDYLSSAGLRIILQVAKLLQGNRGELKLCSANGLVKTVLETSGFESLLKWYDSEKDAFAAFSS